MSGKSERGFPLRGRIGVFVPLFHNSSRNGSLLSDLSGFGAYLRTLETIDPGSDERGVSKG